MLNSSEGYFMTATELTAALRDYLTAIYEIERVKRVARPRDIAAALGCISPPVPLRYTRWRGGG